MGRPLRPARRRRRRADLGRAPPSQGAARPRIGDLEESYGAGEGNRTLVVSLGSFCSAIELHPRLANTYKELRPVQACRGCLASRDWRFTPHSAAVAIQPPPPSPAKAPPHTVGETGQAP